MAIEEGVNRTESLSQMPSPEVKSPDAAPVTTQPLPVYSIPPASPAASSSSTTMHQQATSQNVTIQSSQQVGAECICL